jgi:uncharacterized membrane protein
MMTESTIRSLVKTILWRVTGTTATLLISWVVTGSLQAAGGIALLQMFFNTILYFMYERMWNKINWGRTQ